MEDYFAQLIWIWGFSFVGRKVYSITWGLQYVNLFMINTGFIILAGQALKVSPELENSDIFTYVYVKSDLHKKLFLKKLLSRRSN